jgi:hypothetical protein
MSSIRREVRIHRPADEVWRVISDPATIADWFPGIVSCTVETTDEGVVRTVVLGSGVPLVEHIVTNDPIARRFQYRIVGGVFREHLGTIDAIDLGDDTTLAVYGTDATPDVMGLVIGGASGSALESLRDLVEGAASTAAPGDTTQNEGVS